MAQLNRESFVIKKDAERLKRILLEKYATAVSIEQDAEGYWLNVSWNCGVTAPLTVNETNQALAGENQC